MKLIRLLAALLLASRLMAADYVHPADVSAPWTPDSATGTGIPGGIDQYRPGGASQRTVTGTHDGDGVRSTVAGDHLNVTLSPYTADPTGVSNSTATINTAITHAADGQVVYLPAGTYRVNTSIFAGLGTKKITLRGAGTELTTIASYVPSYAVFVTSEQSLVSTDGGTQTASGTQTKGISTLTVPTPASFAVGNTAQVWIANPGNDAKAAALDRLVVSTYGYAEVEKFMVLITAKDATTITFWPPLPADYTGQTIKILPKSLQSPSLIGVEDMTIDCEQSPGSTADNGDIALKFGQCHYCWAYNVKLRNVSNYALSVDKVVSCEWRHNWMIDRVGGSGSSGGAVLLNTVSSSLLLDNIVTNNFPLLEVNFGSVSNVIAYNLFEAAQNNTAIITNHGPHNSQNLYEGNCAMNIKSDGYFGGSSENTFYRNWLHGTVIGGGTATYNVALNRFTRKYQLIGNIIGKDGVDTGGYSFGNPNIGNSTFTGTAEPSASDFWLDWEVGTGAAKTWTGTLTTRSTSTTGIITLGTGQGTGFKASVDASLQGYRVLFPSARTQPVLFIVTNVTGDVVTFTGASVALPVEGDTFNIRPSNDGFQEFDNDVEPSTALLGNYISTAVGTGAIPAGEALGSTTLVASLAYSATPGWWPPSIPYPPYDPTDPTTADFDSIPAGYRYVNDASPAPDTTPPELVSAVIAEDGGTITFTFDEAGNVGAGGSSGWDINLSSGSATLSYSSGDGTTELVYSTSSTILPGVTGDVAYTQPGNGIEDDAGNDLANLSGVNFTNNSTQGGGSSTQAGWSRKRAIKLLTR